MNETPPNFGGVLLFGASIGEAGGRPLTHYGLRIAREMRAPSEDRAFV